MRQGAFSRWRLVAWPSWQGGVFASLIVFVGGCAFQPASTTASPTEPAALRKYLDLVYESVSPNPAPVDRAATFAMYRKEGIPGGHVDLNDDGTKEYIAEIAYVIKDGERVLYRGASGNGEAWVLTLRDGRWTEVGLIGGRGCRVLDSRTNGWLDLEDSWSMGYESRNLIYRYDGQRYQLAEETVYRPPEPATR